MAKAMRLFAKWHIWLGWLTGVPLVLWCLNGVVMVAKPIDEVRGRHLALVGSILGTTLLFRRRRAAPRP